MPAHLASRGWYLVPVRFLPILGNLLEGSSPTFSLFYCCFSLLIFCFLYLFLIFVYIFLIFSFLENMSGVKKMFKYFKL